MNEEKEIEICLKFKLNIEFVYVIHIKRLKYFPRSFHYFLYPKTGEK